MTTSHSGLVSNVTGRSGLIVDSSGQNWENWRLFYSTQIVLKKQGILPSLLQQASEFDRVGRHLPIGHLAKLDQTLLGV